MSFKYLLPFLLVLVSCSDPYDDILCPVELKNGNDCEYPLLISEIDYMDECPKCKTDMHTVLELYDLGFD